MCAPVMKDTPHLTIVRSSEAEPTSTASDLIDESTLAARLGVSLDATELAIRRARPPLHQARAHGSLSHDRHRRVPAREHAWHRRVAKTLEQPLSGMVELNRLLLGRSRHGDRRPRFAV